jgi:RNA polymerase sigma-70 factor (ECF subfamily)
MSPASYVIVQRQIDAIFREASRPALATLIRLLGGNFDLAEDALQDAFIAATTQWPEQGIPDNPSAWLISTARFKAIDQIRREQRLAPLSDAVLQTLSADDAAVPEKDDIEDDQLRLIFTCCHPALSQDARLALTLREVCGMTTEQIATAFLIPVPTLAQRIVRAKHKIRTANIPYEVPDKTERAARLNDVLSVIYLIFNEGYAPSSGHSAVSTALCEEAIRLCRLLTTLANDHEIKGLLALMLIHDSRRDARISADNEWIPLEAQNRENWDREKIREGCQLVEQTLRNAPATPYAIQAAIAALHADAVHADQTDWDEIIGLYTVLWHLQPTPVVALNRAVAIAMRDGPSKGLGLLANLDEQHKLENYQPFHAARADLLRRSGQTTQAIDAYRKALSLSDNTAESSYLQRQLDSLKII